jgi:hypothetical protein
VVFSTSGYTHNSNGTYQHNWIAGIALSFLGLIFIGLGYFLQARLNRKKKQPNFASAPEATLEAANEQPEQADKFHEPETASDEVHNKEYSAQTAQSPRLPTVE